MNILWIRENLSSVNRTKFVKLDIDSINSFSKNNDLESEMLVINGEDFCEDRKGSLYDAIMVYFTNPDRRGAIYPLRDAVRRHNKSGA
jgi:hypothetical protein